MTSALYRGHLVHVRRVAPRNRFRYPICFLALDVDELPRLDARLRLFGHNRRRAVALHDRDYVDAAAGLRASIERSLGFAPARIVAITHARVFGYVFNPVTFFLACDETGTPAAAIAEVRNTYGGAHRYVLERRGDGWECDKTLFVSPFLPPGGRYRFRFGPLGERLDVRADFTADGTGLLHARLSGARHALDDAALLGALIRYPLQTVQVIGLIHLQALKLRLLGAPELPPP